MPRPEPRRSAWEIDADERWRSCRAAALVLDCPLRPLRLRGLGHAGGTAAAEANSLGSSLHRGCRPWAVLTAGLPRNCRCPRRPGGASRSGTQRARRSARWGAGAGAPGAGADVVACRFWEKDGSEVMVPLGADGADFVRRLENLVEDIARAERLDPTLVGQTVEFAGDDLVEMSAVSEELIDSSISLDDGAKLVSNSRTLVVAAGCSAVYRKSYHGKSKPHEARELGRFVRMGQTRRGSYILPIVSPVATLDGGRDSSDDPGLFPEVERQFFPRRAIVTLAEGLGAIFRLCVQAGSMPSAEELNQAVVQGVSGDLCLALSQIIEAREVEDLSTRFRWSFAATPPTSASPELVFPKGSGEVVRRVGEQLRDQVNVFETVVYAYVSSLDRDVDDAIGTVKVRALIGPRSRPIKVTLPDNLYHVAVLAHDTKRRVMMSGTLERAAGRPLRMVVVDVFRIEEYLEDVAGDTSQR